MKKQERDIIAVLHGLKKGTPEYDIAIEELCDEVSYKKLTETEFESFNGENVELRGWLTEIDFTNGYATTPANLAREWDEYYITETGTYSERVLALARLETYDCSHITDAGDDDHYRIGSCSYGSEWRVLTDDEANAAAKEEIDLYIDETVLPEIPEQYRDFIDQEKLYDTLEQEGRGRWLARDDEEHAIDISGMTYFIYRVN